jgi:hypothetical protein
MATPIISGLVKRAWADTSLIVRSDADSPEHWHRICIDLTGSAREGAALVIGKSVSE